MKKHKHDTQLCSRVLNKLLFCYDVLANHQPFKTTANLFDLNQN